MISHEGRKIEASCVFAKGRFENDMEKEKEKEIEDYLKKGEYDPEVDLARVEAMFARIDELSKKSDEESRRKTYCVLFIIGFCVMGIYYRESLPSSAFGMWLVWLSCIPLILGRNIRLAYENSRKYYSEQECILPDKTKFLFPYADEQDRKGIPRHVYYAAISAFIGYAAGTGIAVIGLIVQVMMVYVVLFVGVMINLLLIYVPLLEKADSRRFYSKYKVLNIHNWKYRLFDGLKKEPSPEIAGECQIVLVEKKKKDKVYVTVRLQNNDILHHVIANPMLIESKQGQEQVYKLWRLCRVYWI